MSMMLVHQSDDAIEQARHRHRAVRVDSIAIVSSGCGGIGPPRCRSGHYLWWPASGLFFVVLGVVQLAVAVPYVYGVDDGPRPCDGVGHGRCDRHLPRQPHGRAADDAACALPRHALGCRSGNGSQWRQVRRTPDVLTLAAEIMVVGTMLTMLPERSKSRTINALMAMGLGLSIAGIVAVMA